MDADGLAFLMIFFFTATVILLVALWLERKVERDRGDWIARRHRQITHRGFKTRAGIRSNR